LTSVRAGRRSTRRSRSSRVSPRGKEKGSGVVLKSGQAEPGAAADGATRAASNCMEPSVAPPLSFIVPPPEGGRMGQRVTCRLSAEYHQFYLLDEEVGPRIPEEVTDEELTSRLLVRPHLVVVLTFQPNLVAVAVEAVGSEPPLDPEAWDHVAECDLA